MCFVIITLLPCLGLSISWHDRESPERTEYSVGFWCITRFRHYFGGMYIHSIPCVHCEGIYKYVAIKYVLNIVVVTV